MGGAPFPWSLISRMVSVDVKLSTMFSSEAAKVVVRPGKVDGRRPCKRASDPDSLTEEIRTLKKKEKTKVCV